MRLCKSKMSHCSTLERKRIETKGKLQFKQTMRDAKVRQVQTYTNRTMRASDGCPYSLLKCSA